MSSIELSEIASNAMLDVLGDMMNGGSIELLADRSGQLLAVLQLGDPATMTASSGELVFNDIAEEDAAIAQGNASAARVLDASGAEIFYCDVGDLNSDAVIKLAGTTKIYRGQPVRLKSFRLAMP